MAKVCVGIIAKRDKNGNFLPSKPIIKDIPVNDKGLTAEEEKCFNVFGDLIARYIRACESEGVKPFECRQNTV